MNRTKAGGCPTCVWRRCWWRWKTRWQEGWFSLVVQVPEGLIVNCVLILRLKVASGEVGKDLCPAQCWPYCDTALFLPRVMFRGMTRNSGCTFCGRLCFGAESCFTSCSGALAEKSHGRTLSITISPKEWWVHHGVSGCPVQRVELAFRRAINSQRVSRARLSPQSPALPQTPVLVPWAPSLGATALTAALGSPLLHPGLCPLCLSCLLWACLPLPPPFCPYCLLFPWAWCDCKSDCSQWGPGRELVTTCWVVQ